MLQNECVAISYEGLCNQKFIADDSKIIIDCQKCGEGSLRLRGQINKVRIKYVETINHFL